MTDPDRTGPHPSGGPAAPPVTVGRFVLGPELGRGAFGVVHRAYDPTLGREVAVKRPVAADVPPGLIERFTREARAAAGLKHPHVVAVFDAGVDAGRPFIAMELVDGPTLADRPGDRPSPRLAAEWVRDLALALHHAHAAGVLHRDVKPGNVLIDAGGRVRLTDFGISKLAPGGPPDDAPAATQDGTVMGSPGYMSPEQARGDVAAVGPASDQYSLGVVLYELLTGRRPFLGTGAEVMRQTADPTIDPPPPRELAADLPIGLEAVLLRVLAKDPIRRYPTAADLAVDLQRWLKGDAVAAPLRLRGKPTLVCPDCNLPNGGRARLCKFCGRELDGVPVSDSADLPAKPVPAEPRELPDGATADALRAVNRGLGVLAVRVKLHQLVVALGIGGAAVAVVSGFAGAGDGQAVAAVVGWVVLAVALPGPLLEVAGLAYCLFVPSASGARGVLAVAVGCQLLAPAAAAAGVVVGWRLPADASPWPAFALLGVGGLLGAAGWVAGVLFLSQLGEYLALRAVEGRPSQLLGLAANVAFGPPLALLVTRFIIIPELHLWFALAIAAASVAGQVVLLLLWLRTIDELRYELRRRAGGW